MQEVDPSSPEDVFWKGSLANLEAAKVGRSIGVKLLRLIDGDFQRANVIIEAALRVKNPSAYIGKVISNLKAELAEENPRKAAISSEPDWLAEKRSLGARISKEGHLWRISGDLYNDRGEVVGC